VREEEGRGGWEKWKHEERIGGITRGRDGGQEEDPNEGRGMRGG